MLLSFVLLLYSKAIPSNSHETPPLPDVVSKVRNSRAIPVDICSLPMDSGTCTRELIRYYYDPIDDDCKRFTYSGCGGNGNRFMRRINCRNRCVKSKDRKLDTVVEGLPKKTEASALSHYQPKQQQAVTRTTSKTRSTTPPTTTTTTTRVPKTALVKKVAVTKASPNIRGCPYCDPLFGLCEENGECGCVAGFRKLGKICIDINECDKPNACPPNSRCVNTLGSFRCDCAAGFSSDGQCLVKKEACNDAFDVRYTEEDCNNGEQELRYYYDNETRLCRQFFYGGCVGKSRNIFSLAQICETLCAGGRKSVELDQVSAGPTTLSKASAPSEDQPDSVSAEPMLSKVTTPAIPEKRKDRKEQCTKTFDEVLRLECIDASWVERFYWNEEKTECEPFWYDSSCDPKNTKDKNFFVSLERCQADCNEESVTAGGALPVTVPDKLLETFDDIVAKQKPRRIFSEDDPFGLLEGTLTEKPLSTQPPTPSHRQELSNFEPKSPVEVFDREKFMEEFRKKLTSLPEGYKKGTSFTIPLGTSKTSAAAEEATTSADVQQTTKKQKFSFRSFPKRPEKFDRKKFMEEFRQQLNAFPDNYVKKAGTTGISLIKETTPPSLLRGYERDGFDREKFIEEFKKKLTEVPSGYGTRTTVDFPRSFTFKHEPFTLPPDVLDGYKTAKFTKSPALKMRKLAKTTHKSSSGEIAGFSQITGSEKQHTEVVSPQEKDAYTVMPETVTSSEFVAETKKAVQKTLEELSRPSDLCDEPLHPKLEEDCNNENWELRWFFNKERGSCKSFWYGGCETDARNFFGDVKSCKKTCGHKYSVTPEALKPQYYVRPTRIMTRDPQTASMSSKSAETTADQLYSEPTTTFSTTSSVETTPATTTETITAATTRPSSLATSQGTITSFGKTVDIAPKLVLLTTMEAKQKGDEDTVTESTATPLLTVSSSEKTEYPEQDICDQGYDPKWDEDCAGDKWIIRAYYEPAKNRCRRIWWGGCVTNNKNLYMTLLECQNACSHKMQTPSAQYLSATEPATTPMTTEPTQFANASTSEIAADDPLANTHPRNAHFTLVYPRKVPFVAPLGTSSKPRFQLRVNATLVTRYTTPNITAKLATTSYLHATTSTQHPVLAPINADFYAPFEHRSILSQYQPRDTTGDIVSRATTSVAKLGFRSDLDKQLAMVKRKKENRRDLAYSSLANHPVTVASECLDPFDLRLAETCNNGTEWKNRFFYDSDLRVCKMYWHGGCFSSNKNDFEDQETCQWKCMGTHPKPASRACLDHFDRSYKEDCRHGEFSDRYFFNHGRKRCEHFHWGGCQSSSENFFLNMGECRDLCEEPSRELSQACIESFDESYRDSCSNNGHFRQYFYFDQTANACRMFWYGNCRGTSQNIFPTLDLCEWTCERRRDERIPAYCVDEFDLVYKESCEGGQWRERAYFDQGSGACAVFWWDGCTSTSQNFFSDLKTCQSFCEGPGYETLNELPSAELNYQCLLPKEIGACKETYPFYHFDRSTKNCQPFSYSGCGGNENRFLTLTQCQTQCEIFMHMTDTEMDCYMPLDKGSGINEKNCAENAGFRFYYSMEKEKCLRFWYNGCGGNSNNFYSYEVCQRSCRTREPKLERKPRASSRVCFLPPGDKGHCPGNANHTVQRWTYTANQKCAQFTYSGCGGTGNRFATQMDCELTCKGRKPSNNAALCSYDPDSGPCNHLRYMWFYNQTRGTCDQFLYGGCEGNSNRFETFELCQTACEISGLDPCMEPLDRGNWCEAMSNRSVPSYPVYTYYFNKRTRQCRGFHYTGCGKSGNNFMSKEECHEKCEKRYPRSLTDAYGASLPRSSRRKKPLARLPTGYSGKKPVEKTAMLRHVVLDGVNRTYYKSEANYVEYGFCVGYRYNVTGQAAVLDVHFCSDNTNSECISESYRSTNGEEFCNVQRPFLRGMHMYTWYFTLENKGMHHHKKDATSYADEEANAAILLLRPNHCHDIC